MRRSLAAALPALALVLVVCACGGSGTTATVPDGRTLFARNCSACHSLTGAQSPQHQGGDLLHFQFSREVMLQFARQMPVPHPLSKAELNRVVDYVLAVERANR